MKGKRVVALALTGCLMFGQTAWAEGTGGETYLLQGENSAKCQ